MRLLPRSLLWRTFLLLALLMVLSVVAWFAIFRSYEREPRARQLAQTLVSVANLTRAALISARPEARVELLRDLSDREGIRIYPADAADRIAPLPDRAFLHLVEENVRQQLGPATRLTLEREGERALFVSFRIDDSDEGNYWLALPSERIERVFPLGWLGWGVAALLLSLCGAWLIVYRITRPLKALQQAARQVGAGETPARLDESGPTELATVARAFNQMSTDLAQIDQDRALILAGISHDLRTPLARLRLETELSVADPDARDHMAADIAQLDAIIDKFLDYARPDHVDLKPVVLADVVEGCVYPFRDTDDMRVKVEVPHELRIMAEEVELGRVLSNLLENARRYGKGVDTGLALVEVTARVREPWVLIKVRDHGQGVAPEALQNLTQPFFRGDAARTSATGAGLGLSIVDKTIQRMGGSFTLANSPSGGLAAHIKLKLAP